MTRPSKSSLVLDGRDVKLRLMAERTASKTSVHVDWVRFTTLLRNAPLPRPEALFPLPVHMNIWEPEYREILLAKALREIPDEDFAPSVQALELAQQVAAALGPDFVVVPEFKKGHDFYRYRFAIERNDTECGWIGFLASGDSPRQTAQARTIHCNLFGSACTFAAPGWNLRIADLIDEVSGVITRADLALDFFDGYPGGITAIRDDYNNGLCNAGGKLLKVNFAGDWSDHSKGARSIYFGSKEAGKQTNCYEKGDQLFGVEAESPWLRAELRYGNKLRVLPSDMLRTPADFFAAASDWHMAALRLADEHAAILPQSVPTTARLPLETVEAEATRNIRWALQTAAPTLAACFDFLDFEQFKTFIQHKNLPGRLRKFARAELATAFDAAMGRFSMPTGSPACAMA